MTSRVDLFRLSSRWATRALLGVQALHQGLWLGLMEPVALQEATQRYYAESGRYADTGHNTAGLMGWEVALVQRYLAQCRSVLVGAAGGGREVVALARQGFQVEAFDCSPTLVAVAERVLAAEGVPGRVQVAPPGGVPGGLGSYDAVILGWGAYNHLPGREARVRLLVELARHLKARGPLLFTFLVRPAHAGDRPFRWACAIARLVRALRRSRSPIELGDTLPGYFVHRFTRAEIESEVADAGLELEHYADQEFGTAVVRVHAGGHPR